MDTYTSEFAPGADFGTVEDEHPRDNGKKCTLTRPKCVLDTVARDRVQRQVIGGTLTTPPRKLEAPAKVRRLNMALVMSGKIPPSMLRPT